MSINLSGRELSDLALTNRVFEAMPGWDQPGPTGPRDDRTSDRRRWRAGRARYFPRLTEAGVGLAIDDFGSGTARSATCSASRSTRSRSTGRLSLVSGSALATRPLSRPSRRCHGALDLTAIAEGVETVDQVVALQALGCHQAQGFHLGRPLASDDFEAVYVGPAGASFHPPAP